MHFITLHPQKLDSALEAWTWAGIGGMKPIRVTAFADVFFENREGIWFLDTIEGKIERVCSTESELDTLLATEEGRERFLLAALVERAVLEGLSLEAGQCYDFKVAPILGGAIAYENIQKQDFEVTFHIGGQIHQKVSRMTQGTKISSVVVNGESPTKIKPWWKVW